MQITLITDGSGTMLGNPSGWACILRCGDHMRELSGSAATTTNNLMELEAVAQGLQAIRVSGAHVTVRTDSQNVIGWVTGTFRVRNPAIATLVTRIQALVTAKQVRLDFAYVPGHTGDPDNERADLLAGEARKRARANIDSNANVC